MFVRKGRYRHFLILLFLLEVSVAAAVALFNYYIDPMWCFNHANRYNCAQFDIDDRQQKTNYLTFMGKQYDTLIIGNSRVKMMSQHEFGPNAYNYALNGMTPREYVPYLEYAKKVNGKEFDTIVIGLSFAMTNDSYEFPSTHEPSFYFDNTNRFSYRYQLLLNGDVFSRSLANVRHSLHNDVPVSYDRDTVEHVNKGRVNVDHALQRGIADTIDTYRSHYHYLEQFRSILATIKRNNPRTRFVIFTTPVSEPLYNAMVSEGRFPEYRRWLTDAVEVFGQVHHFEYLNTVTRDYRRHFIDGHHYDPETGAMMVHRMRGVADRSLPDDFGMVLDRSNLDAKLNEIERASLAELKVQAGAPKGRSPQLSKRGDASEAEQAR